MTSKQRAYLKSLAMTMEPIFQIGKNSMTPELTKAISEALEARELIKVTLQKGAPMDAREACEQLCARVHAEPVQCIGRKLVLYRPSRENQKIEI